MKRVFLFFSLFIICIFFVDAQKPQKDYYLINDTTNLFPTIDHILELRELHNKVVFIDLWGTRCPPCLKEFGFSGDLKQRFLNDSIIFLYLCSQYKTERDKANEKLWEELIYKFKLEGIHFLLSNECYKYGFWEKFKDKYTEEQSYCIPTYLLVDKKGRIRDFDAPRPSQGEILYDKIQTLLDEK